MVAPRKSKDITRIVDYYMQNRLKEEQQIREALEYYWGCMSDGTIEDYLEIIEEGSA